MDVCEQEANLTLRTRVNGALSSARPEKVAEIDYKFRFNDNLIRSADRLQNGRKFIIIFAPQCWGAHNNLREWQAGARGKGTTADV